MKLFVCLLVALVCRGSFGEVQEEMQIMEEPEEVIPEDTRCRKVEFSIADGCDDGPANIYGAKWFSEICDRQDVCYACGASLGMNKIRCDQHTVHLMRSLCKSKSVIGMEFMESCEWYLSNVHRAIGLAGNTAFNTLPLAECGRWVTDCLSDLDLDSNEVE